MKKKIIVFTAVLCIALIVVAIVSKFPDHAITHRPVVSDTEDVPNNNDSDFVEEDNSPDELPIIPAASEEDNSDLSEQADEERTNESSDDEESPAEWGRTPSSEPVPQQDMDLGDDELPILP